MSTGYEKDKQNIVTITLDKPECSVNLIDNDFTRSFSEDLVKLESEKELAGVIITSEKEKNFMAGADIDGLFAVSDAEIAARMTDYLKGLFRQLETMGKPVVAAINGTALGGGYELALSCHRRIAINNPEARIGLPEVTIGLLPGGGGTQRLPRIIGIQNALQFLTQGRRVNPEKALESGLVDSLAKDKKEMLDMARKWILENPEMNQPWDREKFRWPGGDPTSPGIVQMWAVIPSIANTRTYGNYPAVKNILSCVYEGGLVDFDTACRVESRYFANLAVGKTAKNMMGTFWYQLNSIKKGESRPEDFQRYTSVKLGVLGAGMMGSGIAYVSAKSGIDVVLKDVSVEAAEKGKGYSTALLDKGIKRGKVTEEKKKEVLGRIKTTEKAEDLKGCDLIIEAVFEERELKAKVTGEAEEQMLEDGVFASNTSTLPITGLAEKSSRPEQFIGLHFFSPVDKMQLVEIIVGEKTSDETLAKAFDYVLQIKKIPIVVNDSRGFYTSRVFSTYTMEGMALLAEGQSPASIEAAGLKGGMAVGPLAVSDEVSLSLMWHIFQQTRKDLEAENITIPVHPGVQVVDRMVNEQGRFGKKERKGFYEYPDEGKKFLWPGLKDIFPLREEQYTQEEIIDRMLFAQVIETIRCYQEKVLTGIPDANIGSIFGWGFAPFKGGTLQFVNDYGVPQFFARSRELAEKYGERFQPPELLREMAEKNRSFE
jgi:3-hydroxyacyl-CoA dehydrogenase / enoyl-CoA hydratase / 3-hydroxybutyryl-CoA epimerase